MVSTEPFLKRRQGNAKARRVLVQNLSIPLGSEKGMAKLGSAAVGAEEDGWWAASGASVPEVLAVCTGEEDRESGGGVRNAPPPYEAHSSLAELSVPASMATLLLVRVYTKEVQLEAAPSGAYMQICSKHE